MNEYATILGGIVLAIVTYLLGKKKQKVDTQKTELDSVEQAVTIWRQLAQDMTREMENWKNIAIKLQDEVAELRTELEQLHAQLDRLSEENKILSRNKIIK